MIMVDKDACPMCQYPIEKRVENGPHICVDAMGEIFVVCSCLVEFPAPLCFKLNFAATIRVAFAALTNSLPL
jgi:hypothetical protein